MSPTLHERIAQALGWTEEQAKSFSLPALREVVRPVDPKLAAEIGEVVQAGSHLLIPTPKKRFRG